MKRVFNFLLTLILFSNSYQLGISQESQEPPSSVEKQMKDVGQGYYEFGRSTGIGIMDEFHNVVVEPIYKKISPINNELFIAIDLNRNALIFNLDGEVLYDRNKVGFNKIFDDVYLMRGLNYRAYVYNESGKITHLTFDYEIQYRYGVSKVCNGVYCGLFRIRDKKFIVPLEYSDVQYFEQNSLSAVKLDQKWGVYNSRSQELITSMIYDSIYRGEFNNFVLEKSNEISYMTDRGELLIDSQFDSIVPARSGKFRYKDGKVGFISNRGDTVSSIYDNVEVIWPTDMGYIILTIDGKCGVYSLKKDSLILPIEYESIDLKLVNDHFKVKKNNKISLVDDLRNHLLPHSYDEISIVDRRFIKVVENGKVGYYFSDGKEVFPAIYDDIKLHNFSDRKLFEVKLDGDSKLMSKNGDLILEAKDSILRWQEGFLYHMNGSLRYYNILKNEEKSSQIDSITPTGFERFYFSHQDGGIGIVKPNLDQVVPAIFDSVYFFGYDLFELWKGDSVAISNEGGIIVQPNRYRTKRMLDFTSLIVLGQDKEYSVYDWRSGELVATMALPAFEYHKGVFVCKDDIGYGLVNLMDKHLTEFIYSRIEIVDRYELFKYEKDSLIGILDLSGGVVLEGVYQDIQKSPFGYTFKENDKWGVFDESGELIVKPVLDFDHVYVYNINCLRVVKDKKVGLINSDLKTLLPLQFDDVIVTKDYVEIRYSGQRTMFDIEGNCISSCPDKEQLKEWKLPWGHSVLLKE